MPSPGKLRRFRPPLGPFVRVDSYAYSGYEVPIYYDPMIAKLITWGATREEAIRRMKRALSEFSIAGIKSNINLHKAILDHPKFLDGTYTTQFAEKEVDLNIPALFRYVSDEVFLISAAITAYNDRKIKNVNDYNVASRWKQLGRQASLRN
jgi:acetyl-CoA carboxylase biotin carboxylase subunit